MAWYEPIASWPEVIEAARQSHREGSPVRLWYQAPMDHQPCAVRVTGIFKNGKIRVKAIGSGISFTADQGHLERFRVRS